MDQIDIPEIKVNGERRFVLPRRRWLATLFVIIALVIVSVVVGIVLPLQATIASGRATYQSAIETVESLKNQDILTAEVKLEMTRGNLARTKENFRGLAWTKVLPFVGAYTADGEHALVGAEQGLESVDILLKALIPYADLLGLKGKGTFTGGTTEERMVKAVETLDKLVPEVDRLSQKLEIVRSEVDQIDPNRYPETVQGKAVRSRIAEAKELIDTVSLFLSQARPMVKKMPELVGAKEPARYLVLFQNDAEVRPTGGFLTAYAIFTIDKGKLKLEASDDIYKLDDSIKRRVSPPEPFAKHLNEHVWYIRNANFSPDFKSSMEVFVDMYNDSPDPKEFAGIVAVDTHVLVKIMEVLGPVSAYGINFTTATVSECDCPMVIYELEKFADEPKNYERGSRKDLIGVLLSEIMKKTLTAPKQLLTQLVPVVWQEIQSKHILFYFKDPDAQSGIEAIGGAGRIRIVPDSTDYLHISNANLGGAKSNLYIEQSVDLTVEAQVGKTVNNLAIQYTHPRRADNCSLERKTGVCLSGIYRDYVRIYLPEGSKLLEARGFQLKDSKVYEDLGHTVVDGYFTVVPQGLAKIQIRYETSVAVADNYRLLIQKQPGTAAEKFKITVDGEKKEIVLDKDTEVVF